jgi:hypothetical protein
VSKNDLAQVILNIFTTGTIMRKYLSALVFTLLAIALPLVSCRQIPTPTPSPEPVLPTDTATATLTSTPDPCSQENIEAEIKVVHRMMREFDDAVDLSATTPRDQLRPTVENLQRIRRATEDLTVPSCLKSLHELQLTHMNTFIQTLLAFMSGGDQASVNQGILLSRQLHDQYTIEMARLQGVAIPSTPIPEPTLVDPKAKPATAVPTPTVPIITNLGPGGINIRAKPTLDGQTVGMLAVGQSALALGQSENSTWIMIEVPGQTGQTAWVYAALVQLSGPGPLPFIAAE